MGGVRSKEWIESHPGTAGDGLDAVPAAKRRSFSSDARAHRGNARALLLKPLSSHSKQVYADHSSEYVVFDEPGVAVTAIRAVYDASARASRNGSGRESGS
jgi:hypothetical protein